MSKYMFAGFSNFVLSLLFIPLCYGTVRSFLGIIYGLGKSFPDIKFQLVNFLSGIIIYIFLQILLFRPMKMYIFGHELTHALAGLFSGARINSFKVKSSSGSVTLSKINIFSTLAPYFVPIYSIILIIVYALASLYAKSKGYDIYPYFLFLLGFTIAFHIALTVFAIRQGQSDLRQYGIIFSLLLICIANCIIMAFIFSLFFPVSFKNFAVNSFVNTKVVFLWAYKYIKLLIVKVVSISVNRAAN